MSAKGKLRTTTQGYLAYCPGCEEYHLIPYTWMFWGDHHCPTFTPSLKVQGYSERLEQDYCCHALITDGTWHYLADCSHALAGQSVPLRDETVQPEPYLHE